MSRLTSRIQNERKTADEQRRRDKIALSHIERLIDSHAFICNECKNEKTDKDLSPSQVALIKMRYERLRPSLSSVEQTTHLDTEGIDPQEIMRQVAAALAANPGLLVEILRQDQAAKDAVLPALDELRAA